jgi:glycosyltransferase involved in cell wall biosynthesis
VGIDWERKGGPVLLEAFRKVLEALPDARLTIAGCSPEVNLPNVEVLGKVPRSEVSRLLRGVCVLALPSLREPHGVIVIEALVHGIPVVASKIGALPEMIEDGKCGRIVPAGDAGALAGALIELLGNPERCGRYGEAGRVRARERYSHEAVSRRMGEAVRGSLMVDGRGD